MHILFKKDFYEKPFYSFCQQEYDRSRNYLKNCGKPNTDLDKWFIEFHKDTVRIFGKFLTELKYV